MSLGKAVFWIIAGFATVGFVMLSFGGLVIWWPWLIWALLLMAALAFERYSYRRKPHHDQTLQATTEVFQDPVSGQQVTVLFDPHTGERYYDDSL